MDKYTGSHLVLYTDGSAYLGRTGYGVHGYLADVSEKPIAGPPLHLVTTDGYILRKELSEDTIHLNPSSYIDVTSYSTKSIENNRAELDAAVHAFELGVSLGVYHLKIFTDSNYVKDGILTNLDVWKSKGWKTSSNGELANVDLWKRLDSLLDNLKGEYDLDWLKSHSGYIGNERADMLAGVGTSLNTFKEKPLTLFNNDIKLYWKDTVARDPLLAFKNLCFITSKDYIEDGMYHMMDSEKSIYNIGKKSNITAYSVVHLNTPDPTITTLMDRVIEDSVDEGSIVTVQIDIAFHKQIVKDISQYRSHALRSPSDRLDYNTISGKKQVVMEVRPANLVMRGLSYTNMLKGILNKYRAGNVTTDITATKKLIIEDITESIYTTTKAGGYKLHAHIQKGNKVVALPCPRKPNKKIKYVLGNDLPNKLRLNHLAKIKPVVYLASWIATDGVLRYAIIIDTPTGTGIYSNVMTNIVL